MLNLVDLTLAMEALSLDLEALTLAIERSLQIEYWCPLGYSSSLEEFSHLPPAPGNVRDF